MGASKKIVTYTSIPRPPAKNISKRASYFLLLIPTYSHLFLLFSLLFFTYYLRLLLTTFFDAYRSLSLFLNLL